MEEAQKLLSDVLEPQKREEALLHLSRACTKRQTIPDLALLLWQTPCIITLLIQEIIRVYPYINPPTLSSGDSTRVCNVLALFQCIASETSLRSKLLDAHILPFIYPLLSTGTSLAFEHLRITSLGVIGAVLKGGGDLEVILYLLDTQFFPLCLRSIEIGNQISKTLATFILEKIVVSDIGLRYACASAERFFGLNEMLSSMVFSSTEQPSARLIRHIIRCYLRLSHHPRAREVLRHVLPSALRDGTFCRLLQDEVATKVALQQLLDNVKNG